MESNKNGGKKDTPLHYLRFFPLEILMHFQFEVTPLASCHLQVEAIKYAGKTGTSDDEEIIGIGNVAKMVYVLA